MHTLPPLPFERSDLEPFITANTLGFHYDKHHQTYVTNLNNLLKDGAHDGWANASLEEIIMQSNGVDTAVFNNAAQVWNHTFYWHCLRSQKTAHGAQPSSSMVDRLNGAFGSVDAFKADFKKAALSQFGSGWAWLVMDKDQLKITKTLGADLPMVHGQKALLTCDVWEHAYYLDYQNRRMDYVDIFLEHLINWDFVESNL